MKINIVLKDLQAGDGIVRHLLKAIDELENKVVGD